MRLNLLFDTLTWKDERGMIPWLAERGRSPAIPEATEQAALSRPGAPIVSIPILSGLYHDYRRAA